MPTDQSAKCVLSNEDPAQYNDLLSELRAVYLPLNSVADSIVGDIAVAQWQLTRLDALVARHWEIALAAGALSSEHAAIHRFNRQIDQLQVRIARLERRLKFIRANFPQEIPLPVEDTATGGQNNQATEEPIIVKDACPETIAFYRRYYPKSPIVISPPEHMSPSRESQRPVSGDLPIPPIIDYH